MSNVVLVPLTGALFGGSAGICQFLPRESWQALRTVIFTLLSISLFPHVAVFVPDVETSHHSCISSTCHLILWGFFHAVFPLLILYLEFFSYLSLQNISFFLEIYFIQGKAHLTSMPHFTHICFYACLTSSSISSPFPFAAYRDPKRTIYEVATVFQGLLCLSWCSSPHFGL